MPGWTRPVASAYIATLQRTLSAGPLTIGRSIFRAGTTTRVATRSAGISAAWASARACRAAGSSAGRATASRRRRAVTTISRGVGRRRRLDGAGVRQQPAGDQRHAEGGQDGRQEAIAKRCRTCSRERHATSGRQMTRPGRSYWYPPAHGVPAFDHCRPAGRPARRGRVAASASCSSGPLRSARRRRRRDRRGREPGASAAGASRRAPSTAAARQSPGSSASTENFHVGEPAPALSCPRSAAGRSTWRAARQARLGQLHADDCEPCIDEFPLMNGFAARYADDGLVIVAVDIHEDEGAVAAFACGSGDVPVRARQRWGRAARVGRVRAADPLLGRQGGRRPRRGARWDRRRRHGPRRAVDPAGRRGDHGVDPSRSGAS